jgi:hypothetical protein
VAFDTKIQGKIGFETLESRKGPSLPTVHVWKGSILCLNGPKRFVRESSLNSGKRRKYDKYYSSGDIGFPLVKGFHKEGIMNRKTDSPHMKYPGIYVEPPWEKCLREPTW